MIQLLKLHDFQKMPWKNGLGFTLEIARKPSAETDDFDWRVSMADVENDGEFSYFSGKKRIISTLSGIGMQLSIADQAHVDICSRNLFAFDGEQPVYCRLLNGPIRDLNLIYRADKIFPRMQWLTGSHSQTILSAAQDMLIFNMADVMQVSVAAQSYTLEAFDCLKISNQDEALTLRLPQNSVKDCCLIELFERSSSR